MLNAWDLVTVLLIIIAAWFGPLVIFAAIYVAAVYTRYAIAFWHFDRAMCLVIAGGLLYGALRIGV